MFRNFSRLAYFAVFQDGSTSAPLSDMNSESELIREPQSGEFQAFTTLVDVLLSVSRVELQKKLQGDKETEPDKV